MGPAAMSETLEISASTCVTPAILSSELKPAQKIKKSKDVLKQV
jgi:hypothetical protein